MSGRVRFVLLRPRNPENLGAVARAMKNFALADWALIDPRTHDFATARRVAVHAEDVLDRPRIESSLDAAISDCVWVVGTSSRHVRGKRRLSPREVATEAISRIGEGNVALVFGDERSGMTNEEIDRCHDLSAAPTAPEQPSINLAQAALLYAYELRVAALEVSPPPPPALPRAATDAQLVLLEETLRQTLRAGGFLRGPERHAVRDLLAPLRRGRPTKKEVELWMAALKGLVR